MPLDLKGLHPLRIALWSSAAALLLAGIWVTGFGERWPAVYYMTGSSMEPTLAAGEYFLVWSPPGRFDRGELVIFRYEDEEGDIYHVLRRTVGLPGDTVAMRDGAVFVNGKLMAWPYRIASPEVWRSELAIEGRLFAFGPWIVPADSVVLLSDTRDIIGWPDSRFLGFVPTTDIVGVATRTLSGRSLR